MDKRNALVLIAIVLVAILTACTTYEYKPTTPTGEVISSVDNTTLVNTSSEGLPQEVTGPVVGNETQIVTDNQTEPSAQTPQVKADVTSTEGDLIDLKPFVRDPDGDPITLGFTKPFNEKGEWQTKVGDAGLYSVIVTATDNKTDSFVTKQMIIQVMSKNKAPVINIPDQLEFNEGDLIILEPNVTDEDSKDVYVTYSGWMNSKSYQSKFTDAGTHSVTIRADDGTTAVYKNVTIVVNKVNRPPVISLDVTNLTVTEGDLVEISAKAVDPEDESVTLAFSPPLTKSGKWQTQAGDAGAYFVNVSASDGVNEVTQQVEIIVLKKNTAPIIDSVTVIPPEVVLKKPGDTVTVKLDVKAHDPDGDNVTITYSGYMDSATKTIQYGESGGEKKVTVTVSDGVTEVTKDVTFEMNNWPCFDCQI